MTTTCVCCGRRADMRDLRVDRGRMHLDCYTEHHCGPERVWPPDHTCTTPAPSVEARDDH